MESKTLYYIVLYFNFYSLLIASRLKVTLLYLRPIPRPLISRYLIGFSEMAAANGNTLLRRDEYSIDALENLPDFAWIYASWVEAGGPDRLPALSELNPVLGPHRDGLQKHVIDVAGRDPNTFSFAQFNPETRLSGDDLAGSLVRNFPDAIMAEALLADYSTSAMLRRSSFMEISLGTGGIPRRFARLILPLGTLGVPGCTHLLSIVRLEECATERQVAPFHFKTEPDNVDRALEEAVHCQPPFDHFSRFDFSESDDIELLEQFLVQIFPRIDPHAAATRLTAAFGNLAEIVNASPERLKDVGNLSYGSIAQLKAAAEMAARVIRLDLVDKPLLENLDELMTYCRARIAYRPVEVVRALFVDNRHRLIHDEQIGHGRPTFAPVESRAIIKRALNLDAAGIVMVHNHPSDDATPSAADIHFSSELRSAADYVDIEMHDHLIVTRDTFTSLRQLGYLRRPTLLS